MTALEARIAELEEENRGLRALAATIPLPPAHVRARDKKGNAARRTQFVCFDCACVPVSRGYCRHCYAKRLKDGTLPRGSSKWAGVSCGKCEVNEAACKGLCTKCYYQEWTKARKEEPCTTQQANSSE